MEPVKWAWLIIFGGQLDKSMENNNDGSWFKAFLQHEGAVAVVMNTTIAGYSYTNAISSTCKRFLSTIWLLKYTCYIVSKLLISRTVVLQKTFLMIFIAVMNEKYDMMTSVQPLYKT